MHNIALNASITPALILAASVAGRRWGAQVGGWLVGLPLTSAPVAFFLAEERGTGFAAGTAVGMLAGTVSQAAFALAYRHSAQRGWRSAVLAGSLVFAATTFVLSFLHWPALATFGLVAATLSVACWLAPWTSSTGKSAARTSVPRWDIPVRMLTATGVVLTITALAPVLGPYLAGLLSPFPVFGAVLTIFTHRTQGAGTASGVLAGLLVGLFAPAAFFLALAVALPAVGLLAFAIATAAAIGVQLLTILVVPRGARPA